MAKSDARTPDGEQRTDVPPAPTLADELDVPPETAEEIEEASPEEPMADRVFGHSTWLRSSD